MPPASGARVLAGDRVHAARVRLTSVAIVHLLAEPAGPLEPTDKLALCRCFEQS